MPVVLQAVNTEVLLPSEVDVLAAGPGGLYKASADGGAVALERISDLSSPAVPAVPIGGWRSGDRWLVLDHSNVCTSSTGASTGACLSNPAPFNAVLGADPEGVWTVHNVLGTESSLRVTRDRDAFTLTLPRSVTGPSPEPLIARWDELPWLRTGDGSDQRYLVALRGGQFSLMRVPAQPAVLNVTTRWLVLRDLAARQLLIYPR